MHALIIKTSSLGDVIHTLPAVSDAAAAIPGIRFDWVVEESLAEIPAWHSAVERVIPVAFRRWRGRPWQAWRSGQWADFRRQLRAKKYDKIIDAQGLLKSAILTRMARGTRYGLDRHSLREPLAAIAYEQRISVAKGQHAIDRVRQLFAHSLDYKFDGMAQDYGLDRTRLASHSVQDMPQNYLVFLHGTTWDTKLWPQRYWIDLAAKAKAQGLTVYLPWGNTVERARAQDIAEASDNARVLDTLSLSQMAALLSAARAVVAVDTGLGHLAAALAVPSVTIYGATNPGLTGTSGKQQIHMRAQFDCAPCMNRVCNYRGAADVQPACYATLPPARVWEEVQKLL